VNLLESQALLLGLGWETKQAHRQQVQQQCSSLIQTRPGRVQQANEGPMEKNLRSAMKPTMWPGMMGLKRDGDDAAGEMEAVEEHERRVPFPNRVAQRAHNPTETRGPTLRI
jgi:hypothetical protein